jgi:hypothetical protein
MYLLLYIITPPSNIYIYKKTQIKHKVIAYYFKAIDRVDIIYTVAYIIYIQLLDSSNIVYRRLWVTSLTWRNCHPDAADRPPRNQMSKGNQHRVYINDNCLLYIYTHFDWWLLFKMFCRLYLLPTKNSCVYSTGQVYKKKEENKKAVLSRSTANARSIHHREKEKKNVFSIYKYIFFFCCRSAVIYLSIIIIFHTLII